MTTGFITRSGDSASEDGPGKVPNSVLLVEDNMLIALDTEEMLRELGVTEVRTAGSVSQALAAIGEGRPDFVLLDFNLGEETSEPVARELAAQEIPFVLATGYSAHTIDPGELGARGILKKPYDKRALALTLSGG